MIEVSSVDNVDFNSIDIDSFWNVGEEKEHRSHRFHAYPAKFPAFITQKALHYAKQERIDVSNVADIFCGCGTVSFEAKRYGIDFWGCDLNPVAVLIAKAKSYSYTVKQIAIYEDEILQLFSLGDYDSDCKELQNKRILYWFSPNTIMHLSLLKKCILKVVPIKSKYRNYFLCAFSNILKPTSRWLTKSIKPQVDPKKDVADVKEAFIKQCEYMKRAIEDANLKKESKIIIKEQNALSIKQKEKTDLIVTSPPYVTSYEYADLHQLSTLWLDFAEDYRELRENSVGSNHHAFNEEAIMRELNGSGQQIVNELRPLDYSKAKAVAKYYYDIQRISEVCYNLLKKEGMALFVIGNTEYKGIHVNNAKHLTESLINCGFKKVKITKRRITGKILTPYRDPEGRFSAIATDKKVYGEEFILIGRK